MRRINRGFTLIELVITLAIMAIVIGMVIPGFQDQIRSNRSVAQAEDLVTALNFARSEAVKRAKRISVCASDDAASCSEDANWTDGWIVFIDDAETDIANPPEIEDAATDILKVWEKRADSSSIVESNSKKFIRFTATGMLGRVDNNPIAITSKVSMCTGLTAREIRVGLSGLVSVRRVDCNEE